ncbi:MAG: energy-coupling factor transporter transmembrane component T family protein [Candidatus Thorarchaeota archaeon]
MAFTLRRVYQGFLYRPTALHVHPFIGILILGIQFLLLLINNIPILIFLLVLVIFENVLFRNIHGSLSLLRAITPLLIFLGIVSFIFGGFIQATLVVFRLLTGALAFSFFFVVTNPSDLTRVLEKMKIPTRVAILPALALMMVPRVAKDAEDTFETLALRGEIKGYIRWLPKTLAIFIASVLYRSEFLAQSLYYRGFLIQKRSHYRPVPFKKSDFSRAFTWLAVSAIIIILSIKLAK